LAFAQKERRRNLGSYLHDALSCCLQQDEHSLPPNEIATISAKLFFQAPTPPAHSFLNVQYHQRKETEQM